MLDLIFCPYTNNNSHDNTDSIALSNEKLGYEKTIRFVLRPWSFWHIYLMSFTGLLYVPPWFAQHERTQAWWMPPINRHSWTEALLNNSSLITVWREQKKKNWLTNSQGEVILAEPQSLIKCFPEVLDQSFSMFTVEFEGLSKGCSYSFVCLLRVVWTPNCVQKLPRYTVFDWQSHKKLPFFARCPTN